MTEASPVAPRPFQAARQLPDNLPFVVRVSRRRVFAVYGSIAAIFAFSGILQLAVVALESEPVDVLTVTVTVVLFFNTVMMGVVVPASMLSKRQRVLFACDAAGLWIPVPKLRRIAMWVPWEAVAFVQPGTSKTVNIVLRGKPSDP